MLIRRLGLMIRWSYGYRYLLAPENENTDDLESQDSDQEFPPVHRHPTMDADENTPLMRHERQSTGDHSRRTSHSDFPSEQEYSYSTAGTSPIIASTPLTSNHEDDEEQDLTSFPPPRVHRHRSIPKRVRRCCVATWREFLDFMNMPLWAMLVAVAIALYPQLQHYLFFAKNGFIRGSVIYAIQTCGDVSIPLILVILGANIANEDPPALDDSQTDPVTDRKWPLTQRQRGIILGVATRMIIVPVPKAPFGPKLTYIVDYLSVDNSCRIVGCTVSYGRSLRSNFLGRLLAPRGISHRRPINSNNSTQLCL